MNVIYNYDKETLKSSCIIEDGNIIGIGDAYCHPNDNDMASERTGMHIAENRAYIKYLQNYKTCQLRPALIALKHVYSTMCHSTHFNPHSYEAKRLRKEIKNLEQEINKVSCSIENTKIRLKEYIDNKDKMAQFYRNKIKIKEGQFTDGNSIL